MENRDSRTLVGSRRYNQWQVTSDSGSDVRSAFNVKDQVHAAGVQIGLVHVPWNASVSFRYLREFEAYARFEGDYFGLNLAKGF